MLIRFSMISLLLFLSGCSWFKPTPVVVSSVTPYLTEPVYPDFVNNNNVWDLALTNNSTTEALAICNAKLRSIRKLQNKNQEI